MKVKYSAIGITNMSGKSGGSVAAFNKHGAYIRRWAKPTNPQSALQTAVRSSFGGWARAFGHLSESAREAWKIFGQNNPRVDRLGESRPMSALNAFMSANQNRQTAGFVGQLSEPVILNFALPGLEFNETLSLFSIDTATNTPADSNLSYRLQGILSLADYSNIRVIVQFTVVPAGSGKSFGSVKTLYSYSTPYAITSPSGAIDMSAQLATVKYNIGDQLFVKAYIIATNGLAGEQVTGSFTVQED